MGTSALAVLTKRGITLPVAPLRVVHHVYMHGLYLSPPTPPLTRRALNGGIPYAGHEG